MVSGNENAGRERFGPADVTCPYCGQEFHVEAGPTKLAEVTHCNNRWIVVDLEAGTSGHTGRLATDGGEPTHEELAAAEWQNVKNWCRQAILQNGDGLGAAMIIYFDESGIGTVPFVHPEYDPREASLWMLGAFLAHLDDSTPPDFHPAEIADHALALMDDYKDDDLVGWSLETGGNEDTDS